MHVHLSLCVCVCSVEREDPSKYKYICWPIFITKLSFCWHTTRNECVTTLINTRITNIREICLHLTGWRGQSSGIFALSDVSFVLDLWLCFWRACRHGASFVLVASVPFRREHFIISTVLLALSIMSSSILLVSFACAGALLLFQWNWRSLFNVLLGTAFAMECVLACMIRLIFWLQFVVCAACEQCVSAWST